MDGSTIALHAGVLDNLLDTPVQQKDPPIFPRAVRLSYALGYTRL